MKNRIIYLLFFIPFVSFSQTKKEIQFYESNYQNCLDKGINMLGCTYGFYKQTDSLLNVVYKKLYQKLDSNGKYKLKKSQLVWLKNRDKEFKIFEKDFYNKDLGANDNAMVILDKKAIYILDRVYFLIDYK